MNANELPLLTGRCGEPYPAITHKVAEKAELVCRTFIGKHLPEFVVADTECRLELPCVLTAVNKAPFGGKEFVAKFYFFEHDEIVIEGGLASYDTEGKLWIFTASTAFLDANFAPIQEILDKHLREKVQETQTGS